MSFTKYFVYFENISFILFFVSFQIFRLFCSLFRCLFRLFCSAFLIRFVPSILFHFSSVLSTEMILGFASRYACLGDLDKWAASRLQVACK